MAHLESAPGAGWQRRNAQQDRRWLAGRTSGAVLMPVANAPYISAAVFEAELSVRLHTAAGSRSALLRRSGRLRMFVRSALLLLRLVLSGRGDVLLELGVQLLAAVGVNVRALIWLLDCSELCEVRVEHSWVQAGLLRERSQLADVATVLVGHRQNSGSGRDGRRR